LLVKDEVAAQLEHIFSLAWLPRNPTAKHPTSVTSQDIGAKNGPPARAFETKRAKSRPLRITDHRKRPRAHLQVSSKGFRLAHRNDQEFSTGRSDSFVVGMHLDQVRLA